MKALALYHDGTLSLSPVHFFCAIGKAQAARQKESSLAGGHGFRKLSYSPLKFQFRLFRNLVYELTVVLGICHSVIHNQIRAKHCSASGNVLPLFDTKIQLVGLLARDCRSKTILYSKLCHIQILVLGLSPIYLLGPSLANGRVAKRMGFMKLW